MLLFIFAATSPSNLFLIFQYISCYCYRKLEYRKDFGKGFQYISCYCLSYFKWSECCKIYGLQYISCYCLSEKKQLPDIDIDLFQYISCYCLSFAVWRPLRIFLYFNTSHVTVYRTRVIRNGEVVKIPIHLMLLFIRS